jgi:hypothetical protein
MYTFTTLKRETLLGDRDVKSHRFFNRLLNRNRMKKFLSSRNRSKYC